jgi:hypothetical protein
MGARFYPSVEADGVNAASCFQDTGGRAIAPAVANAQAILDVFDGASPVGGTPTALALDLAAQELSASRAVVRAIVVATDGAPNCNDALPFGTCTCTAVDPASCRIGTEGATHCLDDTRTVGTITAIFGTRKIPVYVVGIGVTSSFGATLDAMAIAGGRPRAAAPRYYPADTPAELSDAFTIVRDSVAKCSYITPSSPDAPDSIAVAVGGVEVRRDPSHVDGWDWVDQAYGHLQLFGPSCARASALDLPGTNSSNSDQ